MTEALPSFIDPPMVLKRYQPKPQQSAPRRTVVPLSPPPLKGVSIAPIHSALWQSMPPSLTASLYDPLAKYRLYSITAYNSVKYAKASDSLNKLYNANP